MQVPLPLRGLQGGLRFQSPCLGTLFASLVEADAADFVHFPPFNPHVWGLFLQGNTTKSSNGLLTGLSIPMSGDSFCKTIKFLRRRLERNGLSIPMSGDSFCKCFPMAAWNPAVFSFNPHVWGLFLQDQNFRVA